MYSLETSGRVLKRVRKLASDAGVDLSVVEGGDHTKVYLDGRRVTSLPRHREIQELTAQKILRQVRNAIGGS